MLEEILYRGSVENQWLVDAAIKIDGDQISLQAVWVDSDEVEREVEVKAITLHELVLREIQSGEIIAGVEPDIPTFEGPGWMAQVVFDI
jgi:SHS2 domain-containing protein